MVTFFFAQEDAGMDTVHEQVALTRQHEPPSRCLPQARPLLARQLGRGLYFTSQAIYVVATLLVSRLVHQALMKHQEAETGAPEATDFSWKRFISYV